MPSRGHGAALALLCAAITLERVACVANDGASSTAVLSKPNDVLTTRVSDAPSIEPLSSNADVLNAVAYGSLTQVEEWLADGGSVELRGHKHNFTLLHIACENRQLAMIELLLDRGADMAARTIREDGVLGGNALGMASFKGEHAVVAQLIARGAALDLQVLRC